MKRNEIKKKRKIGKRNERKDKEPSIMEDFYFFDGGGEERGKRKVVTGGTGRDRILLTL